jgi:long-chain acyl-CoA synthetase
VALHTVLRKGSSAFPDKPWLQFEGARWTYAQGDAITDRIAANLLLAGVGPGDRVALLFANCPELVFCYFACFKIGAIGVPINTRFQTPELIYALDHAHARILIGQADLCTALLPSRAKLPHLSKIYLAGMTVTPEGTMSFDALYRNAEAGTAFPEVREEHLAVLLYTSGTTARPKGVMHSHATLQRQNQNYIAALGAEVYAQTLIPLPMCHIAGFSFLLLAATEAGGTLTILPRFEPEVMLRAIAEHKITFGCGLPVMVNALINCPAARQYDASSLRLFIVGGDCVPLEMQKRFKECFGIDIDELCGMTEVIYATQPFLLGERRPGSIGKPIGDIRIRLVDPDGQDVPPGDVGEIVVYSGAVTLGYWNDPDNTAAALQGGGMHTGDLAHRDEDGFYWFAGRSKDIIIRGGSNISPGEVEDALYAHPAVYETGVVGVPCRELGQRVRAYVALKPGTQATDRDLMDWVAQKIAPYKTPESIVFLSTLPKGPTGKVLRKALRDWAEQNQLQNSPG